MTSWISAAVSKYALELALAATAIAVIVGGVIIADNMFADTIQTAQKAGEAQAVAAGQETTLGQIGAAHDAGNQVRDDAGAARYRECLRSATAATASNCERWRPQQPLPGGSHDPDQRGAQR